MLRGFRRWRRGCDYTISGLVVVLTVAVVTATVGIKSKILSEAPFFVVKDNGIHVAIGVDFDEGGLLSSKVGRIYMFLMPVWARMTVRAPFSVLHRRPIGDIPEYWSTGLLMYVRSIFVLDF